MVAGGNSNSFFLIDAVPDYVTQFAGKLGIQLEERYTRGNSGALVYRASQHSNQFVLKIASEGRAVDEIKENIAGYRALRDEGLISLLPEFYQIYAYPDFSAIVMDYVGSSFSESTQKRHYPMQLYKELATAFIGVCVKSRRCDENSYRMLEAIRSIILMNYRDFLQPAHLVGDEDIARVERLKIFAPRYSTFATYDFTPEDVFLVGGRLKLPDPKQNIRGCPIISLAAFAGVSRDSYRLPGSVHGYKVLEDAATKDLAGLLDIEAADAHVLFLLGRAMQLSISAKVRIDSEPERARTFASLSADTVRHLYHLSQGG